MASSSLSFPTSPHCLTLATSRARAPVLRAYVPCTDLSDGSNGVLMCEEQLLQSGLWSHLSAGDIVCNLGYIPPNSDSDDALPLDASNSSSSSSQHEFRQKWLIFNGSFLVPFSPGTLPLPLDDPLSLPSPFYYAHILPASPLANPVFVIPQMPIPDPRPNSIAPLMTLQLLATKVPSPPSPSGVAIARKYMWTATVQHSRTDDHGEDQVAHRLKHNMGDGWYGEWVLETEGTSEGRQVLLDWLGGRYAGPPREWELVRERSGVGRKGNKGTVWLKLLHPRDEDGDRAEEDYSSQESIAHSISATS